MHLITTHNQVVCNVMASLIKSFISPDIVLQNLEAITACSSWTKACMEKFLHTNTYTHTRFYTQKLLHTNAFTHRPFHTQTLLHTDRFIHKHFYIETLLHTNAFTPRRFTITFTHRSFYTQKLLHTGRPMFTQSQWSHRSGGHLSTSTEGWSSYHVVGGHSFNIVQTIEVFLRQLWLQYKN